MNKPHLTLIFLFLLTISSQTLARHDQPEKWYQTQWCQEHQGQMEVTMSNGTRCDCLTDTYAVEVDFAEKWAEAIGQSLNYALQTDKQAGIVLIMESFKDEKYWDHLKTVIDRYELPIHIWTVGAGKIAQ